MFGEMKIFSGSSHPALAAGIAAHMGMQLGKARITRFSNENIKVKIDENVRESDVFVIQTSAPPVSDNLVEMLIMIDALKFASAARITAVLPYYPYARSDKKDEARISITARLVADLLHTAGAERVLTMTLHAPQILGFFRVPADQLLATPVLVHHFRNSDLSNATVVATDAGAGKIAGHFAKRLGLPMAIIDKRRYDDSEEAHSTALIGEVKGKDVHHLRRRDRHRRLHPGGGPHPAHLRRAPGPGGRHPRGLLRERPAEAPGGGTGRAGGHGHHPHPPGGPARGAQPQDPLHRPHVRRRHPAHPRRAQHQRDDGVGVRP